MPATPRSPTSTRSCATRSAASSTPSCAPTPSEWEDAAGSPTRSSPSSPRVGFLGLKYPEEYGGQGGDYLHDAVLGEELARSGSGGLAAGHRRARRHRHAADLEFGTEEQKQRYLAPGDRRREDRARSAITEPGAGSDVAALRTRAQKVDGGWVVNGEKTYITNGVRADFYVTAVQARPPRAATADLAS